MITLEQIKANAATLADNAVKTGTDLYHKGKKQVDLMTLDNKLAKAQRQLGALVYALHKNGETNDALVARYMDTIASIEAQIAAVRAVQQPQPDAATTVLCPNCGAEVNKDAIFCPGCGNKL